MAQPEITALEAMRARAIAENDVPTLAAMTGKDYVHIDAAGQLRTRQQFLDVLASGSARYTGYAVSDNVIAVHGNVAIVTGRFRNSHVTADGAVIEKSGRHSRVYVLRDGGWSNILHHGTEIQP